MKTRALRALQFVAFSVGVTACDTDEATQVTAGSAQLNLKDPPTDCSASNPCRWYYEISTNRDSFGTQVPGVPTSSTGDDVPSTPKVWNGGPGTPPATSVVKNGLTPNTRYYFRVCGARGSNAFYCGTVRSFVTMEGIALSSDSRRFVKDVSGVEFVPFGYTYHQLDTAGDEILRISAWNMTTFAEDVDEMKALGANAIRMRPQIGELMLGPTAMAPAGVARLMAVLDVLERKNVYVDIVGLADYAAQATPWYDSLDEAGRHAAQAFFWREIAAAVKTSPAILALNLINEPAMPASATSWRFGSMDNGKYWFCNNLVKERGSRTPEYVLETWLGRMSAAVRSTNGRHLITFGAWEGWHGYGPWLKNYVDFFEPHLYPTPADPAHNVPASLATLAAWAAHERPVFVGETSSFKSGPVEQSRFVKSMRPYVQGVLSHYRGTPPSAMNCTDFGCAFIQAELYDMANVSPFFRATTSAERRVPLLRFVNVSPVAGRHLHTDVNDASVDPALVARFNVWAIPYQYAREPDVGTFLKVAEPNTAALVRLWSKDASKAIYLADPTDAGLAYAASLGFAYDRLLGFVYKTQVSGAVPLHKCTSPNDELVQKSATCPSGYQLSSPALGYVF